MIKMYILTTKFTLLTYIFITVFGTPEEDAVVYLKNNNEKYSNEVYKLNKAKFKFYTNVSESNLQHYLDAIPSAVATLIADWKKTQVFHTLKINEDLKRQFSLFSNIEEYILGHDYVKYVELIGKMQIVYVNAYYRNMDNVMKKETLFENQIIMESSRNKSVLKYEWIELRKVITGIRQPFSALPNLEQSASVQNKFRNIEAMWADVYKPWDMLRVSTKVWKAIKPLYAELHAFVRFNLQKSFKINGTLIPEHFLGNVYAKSWTNIVNYITPYPERQLDLTVRLKRKKENASSIVRYADEVFVSSGFESISATLLKDAILDTRQEKICIPELWHFYYKENTVLTACVTPNADSFLDTLEMVGLLHYNKAYKQQPPIFQNPANPAIGLSLGGVMGLQITTLKYLIRLGLTSIKEMTDSDYLNILFSSSLRNIPALAFYLALDTYRWQFLSNKFPENELNCKWWKLVNEYQGVEPPINRTEKDFDPGVIPEIVLNEPAIKHFFATVLKFQIHKEMCSSFGVYDPRNKNKLLHKCSLYGNDKVNEFFKSVLFMGSSKPSATILEKLINKVDLDPAPLLEFYAPLFEWLKAYNQENGVTVGWNEGSVTCK